MCALWTFLCRYTTHPTNALTSYQLSHILPMLSRPINYHTSYQCSHALSIITHPTNALTSYQLSHTLSMLSHPIKQQTLQILTLPTNTNLLPINTHQTLSILT